MGSPWASESPEKALQAGEPRDLLSSTDRWGPALSWTPPPAELSL